MSHLDPIYIPVEEYRFSVVGKPWVQKNNIVIRYKNPARRIGPFVGHSAEMSRAREYLASELYKQYRNQGGRLPIDYHIEVDFVFFVLKAHEPDIDNLPAIVCDAMQGVSVKGIRGVKAGVVLENDIHIRKVTILKIVEGDVDYAGDPRTEVRVRRCVGGLSGF